MVMRDSDDDEPITEEEAIVETSNGERYEALEINKSGESEDE